MSRIWILIMATVTLASAQDMPSAVLCAGPGGTGNNVTLPSLIYANNLVTLGFNNQAYSVCLTGAWIFYDIMNFNGEEDAAVEYFFEPEFKCVDFVTLGGKVSSVKYVGSPGDYRSEYITFYERSTFQGLENKVGDDAEALNLNGTISSVIINGHSRWTLYSEVKYGGDALCVEPVPTEDYRPMFEPNSLLLLDIIASVRKGCDF